MGVPVVFSCVGEAQQPTTGRFRQSPRRICRAEIRRTERVEANATEPREKENTPRRGEGRGGGGRGCEVRCGACNRVFGVMSCVPSLVPINNEV